MKCPHCGIEIRDTMTVCMYCGGKIPQRKGVPVQPSGKAPEIGARGPEKAPTSQKRSDAKGEDGGEEEEGGLSAFLQPKEQVLIGSLNVSVKKFFFHAYLTNQRIFLIDTQEKKLKVTAKDIPLSTITGSGVESSETSDPVLVLSIRSADDEVKTMKLAFTGNGLDRSGEVDEWVELLNDQIQPKKQKRPASVKRPGPEPEISGEEPEETAAEEEYEGAARKPQVARQEQHPAKRPIKDHEKQPPVKRLLPVYQTPSDEEMEDLPSPPKQVPRKVTVAPEDRSAYQQAAPAREISPAREQAEKPVRKVEVQSAMKSALKGAIPPASRTTAEKSAPGTVAVRKPVHVRAEPAAVEEEEEEAGAALAEQAAEDEETAGPVFCQNCGKKLPAAANFCPGCGARIAASRDRPAPKPSAKSVRRQEESGTRQDVQRTDEVRPKPPIKKAPKGSEMTILHKFLRR